MSFSISFFHYPPPPALQSTVRFTISFTPDYDNCDYDGNDPLVTESINLNVNHFIAGASVHCRAMMDHALSRLEEAREEMLDVADDLRQAARLDGFQLGLYRAHLSMWSQPDQWRLLSLRIVMGKLTAVALPFVLQSPLWAAGYGKLWANMLPYIVADHMWLHMAGFCPHEPVITTTGFQNMQVLWVKYRPDGWKPEDDFVFPEGAAAAPAPPPPSPPFTPHRGANKKKSKVVPIVRPDGTIDLSQMAPRGGPRGRGRGGQSARLVEPATKAPPSGKRKEASNDNGKSAEEAVAETIDEAGPSSAAEKTTEADPTPVTGPPHFAGRYPVVIRTLLLPPRLSCWTARCPSDSQLP